MYTEFYELREKPFALTPDPRFLFLAQSHREALAHLLYGIDQEEGFIAITGEVGTGKTTLCRTLLERLGSDCEVAFLFNPTCSDRELLEAITAEFGLEVSGLSRRELGAQLNRFLLEKRSERRKVLLIVDEAQNLSLETLEQVRLLSNLETSSSKLIQIVLLGQPELDRKLDSRELRQLRQRIGVRWSLQPLSRRETGDYVRHRLRVAAGAGRDLFTGAALRDIHRRSGGIPRLVNVLCDRSLLTGFSAGQTRIRSGLVKRAAREIPDVRRRSARSAAPRYRRAAGWLTAGALLIGLATLGLVAAGWDPGALGAAVRHRIALVGDPIERAGTSVAAASVAAPPPIAATSEAAIADAFELRTRAASPEPEGVAGVDAGVESVHTPQAAGEETIVIVVPEPEVLTAIPVSSSSADLAPPASSLESSPALEVGQVLARVLDGRDALATRLEAVNSVLAAFGLPAYGRAPESDEAAVGMLRARGLTVLSLEGTNFETLRTLNYPALLSLESELGDARLLAVRHLEDGRASLHGTSGDGPLRLPLDEVEECWSGRAFVAWQDFESIPEVLALGERGSAVAWLQSALAELGCYGGEASGLFDSSTREGLRVFQRSRSLQPDGAAGPRTQMVLYDALGRYDVPRLREGGESG